MATVSVIVEDTSEAVDAALSVEEPLEPYTVLGIVGAYDWQCGVGLWQLKPRRRPDPRLDLDEIIFSQKYFAGLGWQAQQNHEKCGAQDIDQNMHVMHLSKAAGHVHRRVPNCYSLSYPPKIGH
jgi:hypothetical protein